MTFGRALSTFEPISIIEPATIPLVIPLLAPFLGFKGSILARGFGLLRTYAQMQRRVMRPSAPTAMTMMTPTLMPPSSPVVAGGASGGASGGDGGGGATTTVLTATTGAAVTVTALPRKAVAEEAVEREVESDDWIEVAALAVVVAMVTVILTEAEVTTTVTSSTETPASCEANLAAIWFFLVSSKDSTVPAATSSTSTFRWTAWPASRGGKGGGEATGGGVPATGGGEVVGGGGEVVGGGGDGGDGGDGRGTCDPRNVQVSWAKTIHSQSLAFVPAEAAQLPALPVVTLILRTSVWSLVAAEVPQTSQPEPGSAPKSPTQSRVTWLDSVPKTRQ